MEKIIKKIFVITGEASGDVLGGELVKGIRKKDDSIRFYGIGGSNMKKNEVKLFVNIEQLSVMGFVDAVLNFFSILKIIKTTIKKIRTIEPDLIVLIDFPDFNLYIASVAKRFNIFVVYYIPPQIWAWRKGRIRKIKKLVDYVVVTLPFEEKIYKRAKISVSLVEHPIFNKATLFHYKYCGNNSKNTIGILPGSRDSEIKYILPDMLEAAIAIKNEMPEKNFIVSVADSVDIKKIYEIFEPYKNLDYLSLKSGSAENIFKSSSFLIATSGTVTLEAALREIPTLVLYKTSLVNYLLGKIFVKSKYIALPNILLDRMVFFELVQTKVFPENIAKKTIGILSDKQGLDKIRNELRLIKKNLKLCNYERHVSDIVMNLILKNSFV